MYVKKAYALQFFRSASEWIHPNCSFSHTIYYQWQTYTYNRFKTH